MWIDAFKTLRAKSLTLEGRLLNGTIAFRGSAAGTSNDATANGDAMLSVMASRIIPPTELVLVHPEATPTKARHAVLALAFEELQKYNGRPYESGPAGLLFITQQIVDARQHFSSVRVGSTPIADVFRIISMPATPARHWKNLLVANPGRALLGGPQLRTLRAVVIDASHPRTLQHLPALLVQPDLAQVPLRIVVAPPHEALLARTVGRLLWLWDTPSALQLHRLLTPNAIPSPSWGPRSYWLAGKPDLDGYFGEAERQLTEATRLGPTGGGSMEVIEAWAILSALRGLCVPLEQAEHAWRNSRVGLRVRDRILALRRKQPTGSGNLKHFLAMHWIGIIDALQGGYDLLALENVPPKFFSLIDALDQFDGRPDLPLRIVTGGEDEARLLASRLAEIDDRLRRAVDEGTLEVVHQREEARRVAEGNIRTTVLAGARSSRYRYLDIFTSLDLHVVAYPSEAVRDRQRLERFYERWQPMADGHHQRVVAQLKISGATGRSEGPWLPPAIKLHTSGTAIPAPGAAELPDVSLDVTWLSPEDVSADERVRIITGGDPAHNGEVMIEDVDGGKLTMSGNAFVDIYRRETEKRFRVPVASVLPGDYLIQLLDDECESLFERLCEVAQQRRPALQTLHLERWNVAKSRLYQQYGNRQAIHDKLRGRISVGYAALKVWFGTDRDDEGECIGPREEADFQQVALLSGIYRDAADAHATFVSIHAERVKRRRLGRQMRDAIKSLVKGHIFELAVRTAEALNSEVEEVMHALELRVVAKVTLIP